MGTPQPALPMSLLMLILLLLLLQSAAAAAAAIFVRGNRLCYCVDGLLLMRGVVGWSCHAYSIFADAVLALLNASGCMGSTQHDGLS